MTQEIAIDSQTENTPNNNESVAHQIIGKFLTELKADNELSEIAHRLEKVVFMGKPTETALRDAIFFGAEL